MHKKRHDEPEVFLNRPMMVSVYNTASLAALQVVSSVVNFVIHVHKCKEPVFVMFSACCDPLSSLLVVIAAGLAA